MFTHFFANSFRERHLISRARRNGNIRYRLPTNNRSDPRPTFAVASPGQRNRRWSIRPSPNPTPKSARTAAESLAKFAAPPAPPRAKSAFDFRTSLRNNPFAYCSKARETHAASSRAPRGFPLSLAPASRARFAPSAKACTTAAIPASSSGSGVGDFGEKGIALGAKIGRHPAPLHPTLRRHSTALLCSPFVPRAPIACLERHRDLR